MSTKIYKKAPKSKKLLAINVSDDVVLAELAHKLGERVKELNCLYSISRLVENGDISIEEILQGVIDLIPPAWQYPDITCARIKLEHKEYKTANFKETNWSQAEDIQVNGKRFGILEIYYLEETQNFKRGPFLKEEWNLLHVIAERLGHIIEHKIAENSVHSLYEREKKLRKKLQSEMQSRVDFSRKLIHELKTPLTSLMATSQLLLDETRDTKLEKLARYVWEGANNLNSRIEELHDVVKGEIGSLKLKLKPLNIQGLLFSVVDEIQALSKQKGIIINLKTKEHLPDVYADAGRIRQVIFNLINNAYKYAAAGGKVTLRASRKADFVVIEVKDYGPGIPKSKQRELFKPGYQLKHHGESPGGLGVGLTLCKMLVELHGGRIWIESELGKGSSLFFTIPVVKDGKSLASYG